MSTCFCKYDASKGEEKKRPRDPPRHDHPSTPGRRRSGQVKRAGRRAQGAGPERRNIPPCGRRPWSRVRSEQEQGCAGADGSIPTRSLPVLCRSLGLGVSSVSSRARGRQPAGVVVAASRCCPLRWLMGAACQRLRGGFLGALARRVAPPGRRPPRPRWVPRPPWPCRASGLSSTHRREGAGWLHVGQPPRGFSVVPDRPVKQA